MLTIDDVQIRRIAKLLVEGEAGASSRPMVVAPFDFVALKPHLVGLLGTGGFRMILSHALTLAQHETGWLTDVRSRGDGTFDGLDDACASVGPDAFREGSTIVLAQLLKLLVKFIGLDMTRIVMAQAWPQAPPLNPGT